MPVIFRGGEDFSPSAGSRLLSRRYPNISPHSSRAFPRPSPRGRVDSMNIGGVTLHGLIARIEPAFDGMNEDGLISIPVLSDLLWTMDLANATLLLERRPWAAAEIRRVLVRYPAMTIKVMAGIHWEALRLWWKGVPVVPADSRVE